MAILYHTRGFTTGHDALQKRLSVALPAHQTKNDMNPTLLVSWFCTILSLVIIVIRLLGRWVRTERLFREDKVMFWSIIPLLARMAFVHVILIWGTNNTVTLGLTDAEIQHRAVGSKLVLPARILFATYIWITKITILEFLQRLVAQSWHRSYEIGMRVVYGFLAITYVACVISTLTECQPFSHYWQVVPDPGSACRAGLAQLVTMGVCEIITDLVLVLFPIPLVISSGMVMKRKVSMILLFLLSLILVAITAYRIPSTIHRNASQQYRSLLASLEILASTGVANAIVIGSFLRDRGVKKAKFRAASVDGSVLSRTPTAPQSRTKSIAQHHWGSDEDLVRDIGICVKPSLQHGTVATDGPRLAPVAEVTSVGDRNPGHRPVKTGVDAEWTFNKRASRQRRRRSSDGSSFTSTSSDVKLRELQSQMDEPVSPGAEDRPRKMSFFDVGGLVDSPPAMTRPPPVRMDTSKSHAFLSDVGGLLGSPTTKDDRVVSPQQEPQVIEPKDKLHPADPRRILRSGSPFSRSSSIERGRAGRSPKITPSPLRAAGPDDLNISDAGGLLK